MNNRWRALYKLNHKIYKNFVSAKCPYCKNILKHEYDMMDNIIMEEVYYCSNCSYCDEYITGNTRLSNKEFQISYSYLSPRKEIKEVNKNFDKEMKKYNKKLKEQKNKYYRK